MSDYKPVNCDYYDHLEEWATKKEKISINYHLGADSHTDEGVIKDLYVREHEEYLKLDSGKEIKLDTIKSINGRSVKDLAKY